jgi:hypothetical protein
LHQKEKGEFKIQEKIRGAEKSKARETTILSDLLSSL